MLQYYHLSRDDEVLDKLGFTLEKMARGGIYDQLGGGFHRYAVDAPGWCPILRRCSMTMPCLLLSTWRIISSPAASWAVGSPPKPWTLSCGICKPRGRLLFRLGRRQ